MENGRSLVNNLVFFIVSALVVMTPMLRGSVHLWSETLIQMLVLTGGMALLMEMYLRHDRRESAGRKYISHDGHRKRFEVFGKNILWGVAPLVLLAGMTTLFSQHQSLSLEGIAMLFSFVILFLLVLHTARHRREQRLLVYVIIATGLFLSIFGMLKYFDMHPPGLWEYPDMLRTGYTSLTGPYVNRNHMAGFLDMVIPMMLSLFLLREYRPEVRLILVCAVLLLIVTQAMTLSRGGWSATLGGMGFMMTVLMFQKDFKHKRMLVGIVAGTLVVGVFILASTPVVQRINTLVKKDVQDNLEGRLRMWQGTRQMINDHLFTGIGPGTFTEAYPAYQEPGASLLAVYAHNDYLQFVADYGVLVIPVAAWLLFLFFRKGFGNMQSRSRQTRGISLGAMAGVVAILIHSFFDFNLHIPANILLFTVLTALVMKPEY